MDSNWGLAMLNEPDVKNRLDGSPIPQRAIDLQREWRSLLQEDSTQGTEGGRSDTSFLFRPRAALIDPDTLESPLQHRVGDSIGDFQLQRLIGQGAMGQVWESTQISLQRAIALKLIRPDRITPEILRFFRREGRAGARLQHPNIVAVHAMGQTEDVHWIAQEFVDGECSLADFLGEMESLEVLPPDYDRRLALFFYQLADALEFAHDAGVIHRDLKPQNVMISVGDRPKITDFGLARILDEGSMSEPGAIQGTPRYMSPEQALGLSHTIDGRSDVFAVGAMLYQALTLKHAFPGDTLPAVLTAVCKHDPVPPTKVRPRMSRELEAIVLRALEKRPSDRYSSARALAEDLACFLDGRAPQARPIGSIQRFSRWVRRNRSFSLAVGAAAVLGLSTWALFGALHASQGETTVETWRVHVLEARRLLERGDHGAANRELALADGLRPSDPSTALMMASAAVRGTDYREAERLVGVAIDRGYDPLAAGFEDAQDQYLLGLYLMTHGRKPRYSEAIDALERAVEVDPTRREVWFPLYQMRRALKDSGGALAALLEFRKGLTIGDPQTTFVDALVSELEGDSATALSELESLISEVEADQGDWDTYMTQRAKGRMQMLEGDYSGARNTLQKVVDSKPSDHDSLVILANCAYLQAVEEGTSDLDRSQLLMEAAQSAESALALGWDPRRSLGVLALVQRRQDPETPSPALAELRELDPEDEILRQLDRNDLVTEAMGLWGNGQYPEAIAACEAALQTGFDSWPARTLMAQDLYFVGTQEAYREGLEHLNSAVEDWQSGVRGRSGPSQVASAGPWLKDHVLVQTMWIYRFSLAALAGEHAIAKESRERLEAYLVEHPMVTYPEMLNYAEALVQVIPEELRDRERAQALLDQYMEMAGISEGAWPPEYGPTIESIRAGIEDR